MPLEFDTSHWASLLYPVQLAFTIWMLVDAHRRGVEFYWYFLIFAFQPFGAWVYFFLFKVRDFQNDRWSPAGLFQRRTGLAELRRRVERQGTAASQLELGSRLIETGEFSEAIPLLQAVLSHEPDHCQALFALASAQRGLGNHAEAIPLLRKIIGRHPAWGNYSAWHALVETYAVSDNHDEAVASCRELVRVAPTLQHRYILADQLLDGGDKEAARKVLEDGLEDYRYLTGYSRRMAGKWVGKAKRLLNQIG
jgi:hypothetical protein